MNENARVTRWIAANRFPFPDQTDWPAAYVTITNESGPIRGVAVGDGMSFPDIVIVDGISQDIAEIGEVEGREAPMGDEFGEAAPDGGRLLQAVAGEAVAQVEVVEARRSDDRVAVEDVRQLAVDAHRVQRRAVVGELLGVGLAPLCLSTAPVLEPSARFRPVGASQRAPRL